MSDSLVVFGQTYNNVAGFKATDTNGNTVVFETGGGDPWELVTDYTSDAVATIVEASIPSGKQNADLYKVQIDVEFTGGEYPYFGINGSYTSYIGLQSGNHPITYCGFIGKSLTVDNSVETYSKAVLVMPSKTFVSDYPVTSVAIKAYYADHIKAGCRIRVWRLVE